MRILILNGPNLHALGTREPEVYGRLTLGEIEADLRARAAAAGAEVVTFQSNVEVESVSVLGTVVQDQDKGFFMNPSLLERLLPGTGNLFIGTKATVKNISAAVSS